MINSLHVENFTVFRKADFEFVPGINVLVGANATGKTHVLKLLYAMQKSQVTATLDMRNGTVVDRLYGVFRPEHPRSFFHHSDTARSAVVSVYWGGVRFQITFLGVEYSVPDRVNWNEVSNPVYIPPKDMLAHSVGFSALYKRREVDFDETYPDIIDVAITPVLREAERREVEPLLEQLSGILQAKVEVQGERFYLNGETGRLEMHLVAEGWRKIALLYQLIANGSIGKDTVLYWDEPESNLNPSLMDEVVSVLYKLASMGTQIFLATHSYIILKELELQKKPEDLLRMFALERSKKDGAVSVHPAETYIDLKPNLIAEQFDRIYDMTVARAIGD